MRNPLQVLEILESRAKEKSYQFDKLIRHFYNIEFYKAAYAKIYAKEGNMTQGTNSQTIDGFSLEQVEKLIASIKNETYSPHPVRRVEISKRNSSEKRPLGISSFYDKLVQQVMFFILEAIYEPMFVDTSHGYRPNKSCHTALFQVKRTFTGTKWWIEGDIKECFDYINHHRLIQILRKRIRDEKFLRLVRKFLNSGYIFENAQYKTYAGTPQGGVVSPILANIYLNELDQEMERVISAFNTSKRQRKAFGEYKNISEKIRTRRQQLDRITPDEKVNLEERLAKLLADRTMHRKTLPKGVIARKDRQYKAFTKEIEKIRRKLKELSPEERSTIIREIKALNQQMRKLPSMDPLDEKFKRIKYVRYADNFLIGVIGSKAEAHQLKVHIKEFLKKQLHFDLNEQQTSVTHNSKKVRFLGYDVFVANRNEGKVALVDNSGRKVRKRVDSNNIKLSMPHEKLKAFLVDKGYIKITNDGRWKATHRPYLLNNDPLEVIRQYNSEFGGLYQYYKLAFDVKEKMGSAHYLFEGSFSKTLAGKYKTKTSKPRNFEIEINGKKQKQFVNKDGRWGVRYANKQGKSTFAELYPFRQIVVVKELDTVEPRINVINEKHIVTNFARTGIIQRIEAKQCEWCGDTTGPLEVHHVRKPKDIRNKASKKHWELMHIYRNRKTMVLCSHGSKNNCHHRLHRGQLDGPANFK